MTLFQGADSAKHGSPNPGDIYFALDTGRIYWAQSGTWDLLSEELVGDITKPVGSLTTTLATVFGSPGTYGSSTQTPVMTVDAKGRITNLWFEDVQAAGSVSPLITKGDIYTRSDLGDARMPVGVNGEVLKADSSTSTGLAWGPLADFEFRFAYGDASPKALIAVPPDRVVRSVELVILVPFNAPATLKVATTPSGLTTLLDTTDNLPTQAGTYSTSPGSRFTVNTGVGLFINPGSSTAGSGLVTINLED